jgi:hypothetical protein
VKRTLIFFIITLTFLISNAFSWELTLKTGESKTEYFNISLNNTCSIQREDAGYWVIAPEVISGSITNLPLTIQVPLNETPRTVSGKIKYCDYEIPITLTIISSSTVSNCPAYLSIYGKTIAGKTIRFDIRDSNNYRIKNPDTAISIESTETGALYSIDCSTGSCSWEIPEEEKGTLIVEVVAPGCNNTLTKEIELKMMGNLVISAPKKVSLGEDFYIFIYDPAKGPVKYASVQVLGPTGEPFSGKTSENGILYDEALIKRYGIDIKPEKEGKYQIYANMIGYNPANVEFEVVRKECPFECCVNQSYVDKLCQSGYECVNNKCQQIVKPKLQVKCSPENPIVFDEVSCLLLDSNNNTLATSVTGKLKYDEKEESLVFSNGTAEFKPNSPGKVTISVPDVLDYSGTTYTVNVLAPSVPWLLIGIVLLIIVIIIVIFFILKRRKGVKGPEIELESTPATVEKVVTER